VDEGRFRLEVRRARLGGLAVPGLVRRVVNDWFKQALASDETLNELAEAIAHLAVDETTIEVAYFPDRVPPGLLDRLAGGRSNEGFNQLARRYARALKRRAGRFSSSDTRDVLVELVNEVFSLAAERTARGGDPVAENRAAIYALGVVVGHRSVQRLYGEIFDTPGELHRTRWRPARIHLHGRHDLARHFWLSAAIALAADRRVADVIGEWKEQIDAAPGGSGFSFADLLADRAGTRFAEFAVASKPNARLIQSRLAEARRSDVLMPAPGDLPEGLTADQFEARFGDPDSPAYQRLVDRLDQRIDRLPLLQRQPAPETAE
jgi:hypothetical protein